MGQVFPAMVRGRLARDCWLAVIPQAGRLRTFARGSWLTAIPQAGRLRTFARGGWLAAFPQARRLRTIYLARGSLESGVVLVERLCYLVFAGDGFLLHLQGCFLLYLLESEAEVHFAELLLRKREEVPFDMLHRIVDVESQLLEVGNDDKTGIGMLVLVAEGLRLDLREVGRLVVLQLDDAHNFSVNQDCPIGFLGVRLVLLLGDEVEVGRRIERVAKHLDEEFAQEPFLELLLLRLEDVLLYGGIEEIALERAPRLCYLFGRQRGKVFSEDVLLE